MLAATHRLTGAAAGFAYTVGVGLEPVQILVGCAVATLTSAGPTSPDLDQQGGWRLVDKFLPDEYAGHGGPFRHRGLAHWWGLPVAAALLGLPLIPADWRWPAVAALVGWTSHLVGDVLFGQANRPQGRGPGIPLAPWWGHVGLGLDTGGRLEGVVRWLVLPGLLAWLVTSFVMAQGWAPVLAGGG